MSVEFSVSDVPVEFLLAYLVLDAEPLKAGVDVVLRGLRVIIAVVDYHGSIGLDLADASLVMMDFNGVSIGQYGNGFGAFEGADEVILYDFQVEGLGLGLHGFEIVVVVLERVCVLTGESLHQR